MGGGAEGVCSEPLNSVLVPSDRRDANVGSDLLPAMNAASAVTKYHLQKTAVLGVTGMKRKLAELLTAVTGQSWEYSDDEESAERWLVEEE